jgi:hypothetical protein
MSKTKAGRNRAAVADHVLRPFVLEWDPTDLASFESAARRDLVLVKFDGSEMELLWECRDGGIPGRYGSYNPPHWSSGAIQEIEMRERDQLVANVPLSVVDLEARIEKGQSLRLAYHVSGTISATRDAVFSDDLKKNRGCRKATHFVWGYNLGAFELLEAGSSSAGGGARVASSGVGASRERNQKLVRKGGVLAECESELQSRCRIPIRLDLRPITAGSSPDDDDTEEGGPKKKRSLLDDIDREIEASPEYRAGQLEKSAQEKLKAGDGAGCLRDLGRAESLDGASRDEQAVLRARCQMRAGQCEAGRKTIQEVWAARDRKFPDSPRASQKQQDEELNEFGNENGCPSDATLAAAAAAAACEKSVAALMAAHEAIVSKVSVTLLLRQQEAAAKGKNDIAAPSPSEVRACAAGTRTLVDFVVKNRTPGSCSIPRKVADVAQSGVICLVAAGSCAEARTAFRSLNIPPGVESVPALMNGILQGIDMSFDQTFPPCAGKK